VNDTGFMCSFSCFDDLLGNRQGFVERNRTPRDPISQRRPLDQFKHQRTGVLGFFNAVNGRDVRMIEAGEDLGFALEAGQSIRIGREGVGKDLQRDFAVEAGVGRAIRLPHAARPTTSYAPRRAPRVRDMLEALRRIIRLTLRQGAISVIAGR